MAACADNHTPVEHIHLDHVFVAEVDPADPATDAECQVRWFAVDELAHDSRVAHDSRMQGLQVLALLGQAGRPAAV